MSLEDDKQQSIQIELDFSSVLTGEAREAGREGPEASGATSGTENPASTDRLLVGRAILTPMTGLGARPIESSEAAGGLSTTSGWQAAGCEFRRWCGRCPAKSADPRPHHNRFRASA